MTPVEFLTARLDDLEADSWWHETDCGYALFEGMTEDCICKVPEFVLADIAAKRAIIESVTTVIDCWTGLVLSVHRMLERVVLYLCQPFADHPDFDETWRL